MSLSEWAEATAASFLAPLAARWAHTKRVAENAKQLASLLGDEDAEALVAAAWLHDIGYAPQLARTGFHPIDGAAFVRRAGYERIARLVAHHTGARHEAALRGLGPDLADYPRDRTDVGDLLAYCDLTASPTGISMSVDDRLADIRARYGREHVVVCGLSLAEPELRRVVNAVERHLATTG